MFSLSVFVGTASVALMFSDKEKAQAAYSNIMSMLVGQPWEIEDEFGHRIYLTQKPALAVLEDLDKSRLAHIERQHFVDTIRADAMKRAQTNPKTREAFRPPSPPMLVPGMPGMR